MNEVQTDKLSKIRILHLSRVVVLILAQRRCGLLDKLNQPWRLLRFVYVAGILSLSDNPPQCHAALCCSSGTTFSLTSKPLLRMDIPTHNSSIAPSPPPLRCWASLLHTPAGTLAGRFPVSRCSRLHRLRLHTITTPYRTRNVQYALAKYAICTFALAKVHIVWLALTFSCNNGCFPE